jgi:putative DNA primase/helicase
VTLSDVGNRNLALFSDDEKRQNGDDWRVVCPEGGSDHLVFNPATNSFSDFGNHAWNAVSRGLLRRGVLPTFYTTEYRYKDENGKTLYIHGKRRDLRDEAEKRDWTQGIKYSANGVPIRIKGKGATKGIRRVLYDLPLLKQSPKIWICAGEKDAELARYLWGLNATTRPFGEGHWDDDYFEQLEHATAVTVVIDDDDAGYRGGFTVYSKLNGRVKQIRVVKPATGKDLFDHVHNGGLRNELITVALAELKERGKPKKKEGTGGTVEQANSDFKYTQSEYADRFVTEYGDRFRYIPTEDIWLYYDDGRWRTDQYESARHFVDKMCRKILAETPRKLGEKATNPYYEVAKGRCGSGNYTAILHIARTRRPVVSVRRKFDTDPYLINFPNGTYDLRTDELREHRQNDMITKQCLYNFDPTATGPIFDEYFAEVQPLAHWREQILRMLGYSICGRYGEYAFVHTGSGGNGKSTLLKLAAKAFSDYATTASWKVLNRQSENEHETVLAVLEGKHLAIVQMGAHSVSDEQLRTLVAEPDFTARKMHQDERVIESTHTFHIAQNDPPPMRNLDASTRRRVIVVNWGVTVDDPVDNLRDTIAEAEGSYVLTQIVLAYSRFTSSQIDRTHTQEYFERNRTYAYAMDRLERYDDAFLTVSELRSDYEKWCAENGEKPETDTALGRVLTAMEFAKGRETVDGTLHRVRKGVRFRSNR